MHVRSTVPLQSEINVTPLVDVCLVLLIIFMVVMPVLVNGIPVHLPNSRTATPVGKTPMQVTINADKTIYLDSMAIRGEQLASELEHRRDPAGRGPG